MVVSVECLARGHEPCIQHERASCGPPPGGRGRHMVVRTSFIWGNGGGCSFVWSFVVVFVWCVLTGLSLIWGVARVAAWLLGWGARG